MINPKLFLVFEPWSMEKIWQDVVEWRMPVDLPDYQQLFYPSNT